LVAVVNFFVISFVVFLIVRSIESLHRKDQSAPAPDTQAQPTSAVMRLADALDRSQL